VDIALSPESSRAEQDRRIVDATRHRTPLLRFLRRQVGNEAEAEELLQDVFSELIAAYRLMQPIEEVGAWLFRVARNRLIDLLRRRTVRRRVIVEPPAEDTGDDALRLADYVPAADGTPEREYVRGVLLEELIAALEELPEAQREVFIAHEIEGESFQEMAARTGWPINTLLARKHRAVRHLRHRLQAIREFIQSEGAGT
jgi:RNA polymerase sigma factor (sigma-70 family)